MVTAPAATCRAVLALDRASLAGTLLAPLVRPAQDLARTLLRYYERKDLEDSMSRYVVNFHGRTPGAIGIFYPVSMIVAATDADTARAAFWTAVVDVWEVHHIDSVLPAPESVESEPAS